MPDLERPSVLHVPARDIPVPASISPQARAQLEQGTHSLPAWPAQDDTDAWRRLIAVNDEMGAAGLGMMAQHVTAEVEEIDADGARVYTVRPHDAPADDQAVYLEIHGGSLAEPDGPPCRGRGRPGDRRVRDPSRQPAAGFRTSP